MTLNCENVSVAELHIGTNAGPSPGNDMTVWARRNYHYLAQIPGQFHNFCGCAWDSAHPYNFGWDNIKLCHWVDLPAGTNVIQSKGYRFGIGGVASTLDVGVWRKDCPTQVVTNNVICIPAEVISELGLCYLEQQAALYGIMVGCIDDAVITPCTQGPDFCCTAEGVTGACDPGQGCIVFPADLPNAGNPMGGQVLNEIILNYPYDVRVHIEWETSFLQDFIPDDCPDCEDGTCTNYVNTAATCNLPEVVVA